MVDKKVIQFCVMGLFLGLIVISFVSAGLLDSIKKVFGKEPQLAPFNATLTLQGVPPQVRFVNITDALGGPENIVSPIEGVNRSVNVTFIVHDDNSNQDLPSGSLTIGSVAGNVLVTIVYRGVRRGHINYTTSSAAGDSCSEIGTPPDTNKRMYRCYLKNAMQFFYEPNNATTPPNLWTINVTIRDMGGLVGENVTRNFTYLNLSAVQLLVNLTFEGVNPAASGVTATKNVTMVNKGNTVLKVVNITGYNLTGEEYPTQPLNYIPAEAIMANGTVGSECNLALGGRMIENKPVSVSGFVMDYNSSSLWDMHFCIPNPLSSYGKILIGSLFQAYGFNYAGAGTHAWILELP